MQDPEELDCVLKPSKFNGFNINYRVTHVKFPKALRPLLHISLNRDTNNTKLSTIAKETVLLLHRQRCRETSQNDTRTCRKAAFAYLQRTMRLQYPARPSYPHQ
ncbi:hypothetical protein K503DRAFT_774659, partial [Rhizopogon vinicolor AM-OR11-026]